MMIPMYSATNHDLSVRPFRFVSGVIGHRIRQNEHNDDLHYFSLIFVNKLLVHRVLMQNRACFLDPSRRMAFDRVIRPNEF